MQHLGGKGIFILSAALFFLASCSQKISPEKPFLPATAFNLDTLPESEINIPVEINLKPLYALAEKNVDTLFLSPGYPDKWVQETCDTRYKYEFRRSPLQMNANGNSLNLGFIGYYKIIGSTRICVAGAAMSPWTSPCRCGFSESPRRVNVTFTNSINIQPDYKVKLTIKRNEPVPVDKCEVCFWGQDITNEVLKGLKAELDAAKTEMEKNFGVVDLKQQFQQIWTQLNASFNIYGMGWLQVNPQRFRINNLYAKDNNLYVHLSLSAKPVISFEKPEDKNPVIPNMGGTSKRQGFSIFLDAMLNYDSLSNILNRHLANKEFDIDKSGVKKKFIINDCSLYGNNSERLVIKVNFRGSNSGTIYLTGKPVYDKQQRILELKEIDFDLQSKNALLKTAEWLFNRKIINEIAAATRFELTSYIDTAKTMINQQLNHEWIKGVSSAGNIQDIQLINIYPLAKSLVIRSNCTGTLSVKMDSIDFTL